MGSSFLEVLDALYDDRSLTYINVRHEQGGAFMADGLARITGGPSVCLVTSGPGATNLLTGIAAAHVAHSPVVAIAGGPLRQHYGRDAFQEFDLVSIFKPVTKLSVGVHQPERLPEMLRHALRLAMSGRKGPVFLDIPRDVLTDQVIDVEPLSPAQYRPQHPVPPPPAAVTQALRLLGEAQRPLLLVGGGVTWSEATDALVAFAERLHLPMITAYGRNDAVPNAHPLYLGPLGRAGAPEAAEACRHADLVLALGSRLGHFTTFYDHRYLQPGVPLIQVDLDSRDLGRIYPVALGIQADVHETLRALLCELDRHPGSPAPAAWQEMTQALRQRRQARLAAEAQLNAVPLKPQRIYAELRRVLPPQTIVALDAGAAPAYGYDRLHFSQPRTFLTPLDLGGLGFAFPAALGAKLGRPQAPVVAIHGDGGFLMNAQELETAVRHEIHVVTLVLNNHCWGSEKAYQKHFYQGRYIGADLGNPRFDRLAELFGAQGYYVEYPDQIGDAVQAALTCGKPAVVEFPIDPEELPTPATTPRQHAAVTG
ncbi:MAG: acetolactate synthase, large subunit, biosynthetic type [Candidatus Tectimicrobiota bacterium]|nr:MAG: acetolactate synthase, large subunit, biosynthetic type [Candidatus Tectomicrobia bacterium]